MIKTLSFLRVLWLVILILLVAIGVYIQNYNNSLIHGNQSNSCQLVNNTCLFHSKALDLGVTFLQTPVIEEELYVSFEFSPANKLIRAWVEGIGMYMGKTPVIFKNEINANSVQGITFLGSCSEPKMQWQLFIELETETEQTKIYSVLFDTKAN